MGWADSARAEVPTSGRWNQKRADQVRALSGLLTAVAGALLAAGQQFISPVDMGWDRSGDLVVMAVLGGVGVVWGPAIGAAAFVVLELVLSSWTTHWQFVFGLLIVLIVVSLRGGLADLGRTIFSRNSGEATHG